MAEPTPGHTRVALQQQDIFAAAVLAIVLLACASYRLTPGVSGVYHDDAIYVLTAKALATGNGYRLTTVPGAPAQTKYPILYPAVLSLAWKLWPSFPANLIALQIISMIAGALAVASAYLYLVHFGYASRAIATAAGAIAATSPSIHYFSTLTLSEMPFAALVVMALWTLDTLVSLRATSKFCELTAGVIVATPFLCRSAGIVVPFAGVGLLFWTGRRLRWLTIGVMVVVLPWLLWTAVASGQNDQVSAYYTSYMGDWTTAVPSLAAVVTTNLFLVTHNGGMLVTEGVREAAVNSNSLWIRTTYFWLCVIGGAIMWGAIVRKAIHVEVLPIVLLAYLAILLIWPWPPFRFLIPVLPFIVSYVLLGVATLAGPLIEQPVLRALLASLVVAVVITNLSRTAAYGRLSRQTGYPYGMVPKHLVEWSSYERLFAWLRTNTYENDVLASGLDSMLSLYTGRIAIRPFVHRPLSLFYGDTHPATGTPEEFRTILRLNRVQYLVSVPLISFSEEAPFSDVIMSWRSAHPQESRLVYTDDNGRFKVFQVLGSP